MTEIRFFIIASAKYFFSPEILSNGITAMDGLSGNSYANLVSSAGTKSV